MTNPNGTRWDHDLERRSAAASLSASVEPARRHDGRWIPSTQGSGAPGCTSAEQSTAELAVTRVRYPRSDEDWDPMDEDWDPMAEYDPEFEAASNRFFATDPGKRPTYEDLTEEAGSAEPVARAGSTVDIGDGGNGAVRGGVDSVVRSRPERDGIVVAPAFGDQRRSGPPPRPSTLNRSTGEHRVHHPALEGDDEFDGPDDSVLATGAAARRNAIEWAVVLVAAVLLALVLRALVLQAFYIPSPSMEDTLLVQDRVLVNKLSYRLGDVGRGDIVVFHRTDEEIAAAGPGQPKDVIKRVIAFGGETIEIRDNAVHIDGQTLIEPYLDADTFMPDFGPLTVPDGYLFVMGDNRNQSSDSRGELGPVAEGRVVGRAFVLFWPLDRITRL